MNHSTSVPCSLFPVPCSLFPVPCSLSHKGFTLVEMLVVIGIIAILIGASIGGFTAMTKSAEKSKAQELVSNVATALTAMFQDEGAWPKRLINGKDGGEGGGKLLDEDAAYALVAGSKKYFSLTVESGKLAGLDRFGIVSPWATTVLKRVGKSASESTKVGDATVKEHRLRYAIDLDGDGIIEGVNVGGASIDVRATAIVWCCGKDGVFSPYPYGGNGSAKGPANKSKAGQRSDDVYSWTPGQTRNVK